MTNFLKLLNKYVKMSNKRKVLSLSIFFILGVMRLFIIILPFRKLVRIMGNQMAESKLEIPDNDVMKVEIVGIYVHRISMRTPWKSECLVSALTAQFTLRLLRISSTLYLGLAKEGDKLTAHAWLRCGPLFVTGGDIRDRFKVVAKFAVL